MNANLQPPMPAINIWLADATKQLSDACIDSAQLDAELLLSAALQKERIYLHSHPEHIICSADLKLVNSYLLKRLQRAPIAYILSVKEFYGRNFTVNQNVLIPRPESEAIIEILREILPFTIYHLPPTIIDVGTGSGCLGITAKLEFPALDVTLTDISPLALKVAKSNAKALQATLNTVQSDLLANIPHSVDIIVANLPYVDKSWECSPETAFEPALALFADDNGEALIKRLIIQAAEKLSPNGYLIIESDPRQHKSLIEFAKKHSFSLDKTTGFILSFNSSAI